MNYKYPILYVLVVFFFLQNQLSAQTADFSTDFVSGSCNNKSVNFTSLASATTTATSFTFNGGALPAGWTSSPFTVSASTCPGKNSPDNTAYFWATNTQTSGPYTGQRFVETNNVDVSLGGNIEFYIRYGNNEGSGCEQPDASNEEVYLQYSINNGASWVTIFDGWDTTSAGNFPWYNWYFNSINIPLGAQTSNTKFRWHQPSNSGTTFDNWGLEDVSINATLPITVTATVWDFGDGTTSTQTNPNHTYFAPAGSTTYNVTLTATFSNGAIRTVTKPYVVNVNEVVLAPSPTQTLLTGSTVSNLDVVVPSGYSVEWFLTPTGGTALSNSTILVSGTTYYAQTRDLTTNCGSNSRSAVIVTLNNAPTVSMISNQSICENTTSDLIPFTISDVETNTNDLVLTGNSSNQALIPNSNISIVGTGGSRTVQLSPITGQVGNTTITITIDDTNGGITTRTFTVEVTANKISTFPGNTTLLAGTPELIDNQLIINEPTTINGALVLISSGFVVGDILSYTGSLPVGVSASYNSSTGVLTFNGSMTSSELQTLLRTVTINTTSTNDQDRIISFTLGNALPFSENNHYYQFVVAPGISWPAARTAAEGLFFFGQQGYLATVTSATENQFIVSKIQGEGWMGASDAAVEGQWRWMTGPEAGQQFWQGLSNGSVVGGLYNNWESGEPNNVGDEDYAHFLTSGRWNDYPVSLGGINGYVVEFGGMSSDPCVVVSANKTVEVIVNFPPTISAISNQGILCPNTATSAIAFSINDENTPLDDLIVTASSTNTSVVPNSNITFSGSGGNRSLVVTSAPNQSGTTTITVTVTDSFGTSTTSTFNITFEDTTLPVVFTQNATLYLDSNGTATITATTIDNGSYDNCGIASIIASQTAFDCSDLGVNTITLTVTDVNGNMATATATVTVIDNTNPVAIAQNITLPLDSNNQVVVLPSQLDNGSYDNCNFTLTVSPNIFGPSNIGTNNVFFVITDSSGNSHFTTATITIIDNTPPVVITQNATVTLDSNGQATITANTINNGSTDNTQIASVSVSPDTFSCTDLGDNIVTMTIVDVHGNSNTNTAIVTVTDAIAPTIACSSPITVQNDSGLCGSVVNYPNPIVNDNCSVPSSSNVITNGDFENGMTGWTIDSGNGSNLSCNQVWIATTNTCPCSCLPNSPGSNFASTAIDGTGPTSYKMSQPFNVPTGLISADLSWIQAASVDIFGTANRRFEVTLYDATNTILLATLYTEEFTNGTTTTYDWSSRNINALSVLSNHQGNTITLRFEVYVPEVYTGPGALGIDNISLILTDSTLPTTIQTSGLPSGSLFPVGITTNTFTVTDASGNASTCSFIVTVEDTEIPTITAPASVNVPTNNGCFAVNVVLGTPITSDNCTVASVTNDAPAAFPLGNTTVTWTVVDAAGNTATATQIVTVEDNELPTIVAPIAINTTTNTNCTRTGLVLGNPVTTDNCSVANVTNDAPAAFPLGSTTVTWTVTDAAGNTATATQVVTVTDATLPTITAPAAVNVNTNTACTATGVILGTPVTDDNCSVATVTNDAPAAFPVGTTTVTWTVTDGSGNIATATQTVTVTDNILPTITAPAAMTINTNDDCFAVNVALGTPTTADNCTVASVTNDAPAAFPLGNTTVTWTVVDAAGNTATATQIVTVEDNELPTIVAPIAINTTTNTNCTRSGLALGNPVTTDNCSVANVTNDAPAAFPLGSTTVTWTVTDAAGNTATATQVVTVTDATLPTITAPMAITQSVTSGCSITGLELGIPVTDDNCSVATVTNDAPAAFPVGTTTVTWTVTDGSGNIATATQTVTIIDEINPTITAPNAITVPTNNGCFAVNVVLGTPTVADNCSIGSVTNNALTNFPLGTTTVTWTVVDASGNMATATQMVTVIDTELPTIVAPIAINTTTNTNCTRTGLVLGNPVALDNCSVASVTNDAPTAFPIGSTTVTWTVTDGSGNVATATQVVTVTDILPPTVITQNITIALDANGNASITAASVNNGTFDNCAIASIVVSPTEFTCANLGQNVVVLTATDSYGNVASGTATVTVIDTIAPSIGAQNITIVLDEYGLASITPEMIENGSTDNCEIANTAVNISNFNCDDLGINEVIYTITDTSGNSTSITILVAVISEDIDTDFDGIPNNCDSDDDGDGILDEDDNCPQQFNPDQADFDEDGLGDICDDDDDNDGVLDKDDNCQFAYNPFQEDRDNDGKGDACDKIEINISQAITPNGDGINDTWMIYNIENYPNNKVRVYNRWGDLVFSANGYNNEWNGHYKNRMQSLPDGASYYYQIDLDGNGSIDYDGWIYISRK